MTPQLQQAIKMLQLSNAELAEFVDSEIEQNPLLEQAAPGAEEAPLAAEANEAAALESAASEAMDGPSRDLVDDAVEHWRVVSGSEGDGTLDLGGEAAGDPSAWPLRSGSFDRDADRRFEQAASRPQTLR